jgi:hypothetical protein
MSENFISYTSKEILKHLWIDIKEWEILKRIPMFYRGCRGFNFYDIDLWFKKYYFTPTWRISNKTDQISLRLSAKKEEIKTNEYWSFDKISISFLESKKEVVKNKLNEIKNSNRNKPDKGKEAYITINFFECYPLKDRPGSEIWAGEYLINF